MSESVKAAQTLVWRASRPDANKVHPNLRLHQAEKLDSVGGERGLSSQRFTRVSRM